LIAVARREHVQRRPDRTEIVAVLNVVMNERRLVKRSIEIAARAHDIAQMITCMIGIIRARAVAAVRES